MKTRLLVLLVVLLALGLALAGATLAQAGDIPPAVLAAPDWDDADPTAHASPSTFNPSTGSGQAPQRPTATAPAADLGEPRLSFRYVKTFGEAEVAYLADTAHLNFPSGLGVGNGQKIWITEQWGKRALSYTREGAFVSSIGEAGFSRVDGLWEIADVAEDPEGNTWLADEASGHVLKFDANGNYVSRLWQDSVEQTHLQYAVSIAFDTAGNIYVSDGAPWWSVNQGNHRIQIFDHSGNYLSTIGTKATAGTGNMQLHGPRHLTIYGDRLYVADSGNHRLQIYNIANPAAPAYAGTIGVTGQSGSDNAHLNRPEGVAVERFLIFVADRINNRVQVYMRDTLAYRATIGGWGSEPGHFWEPMDVAVDSAMDGKLYVADFVNSRVQQFNVDATWTYQRTYGVAGVPYLTDSYHYNSPAGVAVAPDGSIYIAEDMGHRLVKLNAAGQPQWTVGMPGLKGDWYWANDMLDNPADVALDSAGRVYVADRWHSRVQIYNADGTYYATVPDTHFDNVGGLTIAPNGYLYVADTSNRRVQVFDAGWNVIGQLGVTSQAGADNAHFNQPEDVAVDSRGVIYVADQQNHRVQVFNSDRVYVRTIGETGVCRSDFDHLCSPNSLAADAADRLYIADTGNNRIQVFDADGAYLTTIGGSWGKLTAQLRGPEGVAVAASGDVFVADRGNHRVQKFAPGVPGWRQANINGFGDRQNMGVGAIASFADDLYDGLGTQLWRMDAGGVWTQVRSDGFGDQNNWVDHLFEFQGQLYIGLGNQVCDDPNCNTGHSNGGEVWRSSDGTNWSQVVSGGFGDTANVEVQLFTAFGDQLYAGTWSGTSTRGFEIWRSATGDQGTWSRVVSNGFGDAGNMIVLAFAVHNGYLYAGTYNATTGGEVWRTSNGSDWIQVNADGFGNINTREAGSLTTFGDSLYVGTYNRVTGAQIWRCNLCDGMDWSSVVGNGFGHIENRRVAALTTFNGNLYAITNNYYGDGMEVRRTTDGVNWTSAAPPGFGDSNNTGPYWGNSVTVAHDHLYIGTQNSANGAEIWMKTLTADFTATPTRGAPPLTVAFANTSAGDFTTSQWDFGDGGTSTEISPTHTYTAAGTYTVTLTVGDGVDTSTLSKPAYVVAMHSVYLPLVMRNWNFDPLLYDDFNDPAFNGTYNPALWLASDTTGYEIRQSNGALVFSNPVPAWRTVSMRLKRPEVRSLQSLSLLQARFKLDGNCTTEYAGIRLQYSAQNVAGYDEWVAECRLCRGCYYQQTNSAYCSIILWKNGGSRNEYFTPGQLIDLDTWHLLRIETDSHTANLRFYLDGSLILQRQIIEVE